jgi:hypothetical protein
VKLLRDLLTASRLWILALPIALILLGALSNQAVLWANHDTFPVLLNPAHLAKLGADANGMLDDIHCVMTSKTHLNFLADIFDFQSETDSIGDLLLNLGGWLWNFAPYIWGFTLLEKAYREQVCRVG